MCAPIASTGRQMGPARFAATSTADLTATSHWLSRQLKAYVYKQGTRLSEVPKAFLRKTPSEKLLSEGLLAEEIEDEESL